MFQNKLSLLFISVLILVGAPAQAHAFSYTQVHSIWQDPTYTSNSTPDYFGPIIPGWGFFPYYADPTVTTAYITALFPTYEAMCDSFATAQGYTNTTDFYCVYDARVINSSFGTPCFGTACSPGSGTVSIYNGYVKLYTSGLSQSSFSNLTNLINAAWTTYFLNVGNGILPNPIPTNPQVCDTAEPYQLFSTPAGFVPGDSGPIDRCNIYHHAGTPSSPPVALLTVSPATPISAGSSALLTYSCSNGATSASIDNGVGSVSPAASGSVGVTPGASTTYTLTCTNANGSGTAQATVTVTAGSCVYRYVDGSDLTDLWGNVYSGCRLNSIQFLTQCAAGLSQASDGTTAPPGSPNACKLSSCEKLVKSGAGCSVSLAPDLTASLSQPPSATVGTPVTLQALIINSGNAATGAVFTNLFQVASDASGTGATDIGTVPNVALASGISSSASLVYSFPSAGTWYVRVCADKSSAGNLGVITESDETNNCAGAANANWTPVTVTAVATPSCTFTASPTTSVPSTLTWSCVNVTSCTGGGFSTGAGSPITGSAPVSAAGTYILSCTGPSGSVSSSVTVGSSCSGTPTGTLSASQTRVRQGTPVTLTISSVSNVKTSCTLAGPGVNQSYAATACSVPGATVPTPAIATQSLYTLTCDGIKVSSVVVNVIPNFSEF